jgi:hypothetical protein
MFKKLGVMVGVVAATAALAGAAFASTAGSVQVTLTSPKVFVGKGRSANISCTDKSGVYVASFGRTSPGGGVFRGALTVPGYHGAGNYTGRLTVFAHRPGHTAAGTWGGVRVAVTQNGGSSSFSRVLPGIVYPQLKGKVIAGTVTWTCNT